MYCHIVINLDPVPLLFYYNWFYYNHFNNKLFHT